jgi:hypothetical protein
MKSFIVLFTLATLVSCGPRRQGHDGFTGKNGANGKNGKDGVSYGIHLADATSEVCSNGGVVLSTFTDSNGDGILDLDEPIHQVKTLCNGIDGQNGADGQNSSVSLESIPSGAACPTGGVMLSSPTSSPQVICNGVNGLNGADGLNGQNGIQGIQGPMGPQGPAGINGTSVIPVKFCSASTAQFPEYGLKIGNDVFAVFWNNQAFLTKLPVGTYRTTTGNQDCNFTIN